MSHYRFTKHVFDLLRERDLDPVDVSPEQIVTRFRSGDCWEFGLALYAETRWPLVIVFHRKIPFHVVNKHPSGKLVDASGFTSIPEMQHYYRLRRIHAVPATLQEVTAWSGLLDKGGYRRCYSVRDAAKWLRTMRHPPFDKIFPPAETFG